jgi:hypothetical protein
MTRQIAGLEWARPSKRPAGIPIGRPRGAKLAGIRYERGLASALPAAKHGQWFEFKDAAGPGVCQTDLLLGQSGFCLILEVKYTWTIEGHRQLEQLYLPVVERAIARPCLGIVVCRRLVEGMRGIEVARSLAEAVEIAAAGRRPAWHWLGPRSGGASVAPALAA